MPLQRDSYRKKFLVGMAPAFAHRLVGRPVGRRKLARRNESCGSAGKALRLHEQPLFCSLDEILRPQPAVLHAGICGCRPCRNCQPQALPQGCGARFRQVGQRVPDRQAIPGHEKSQTKPHFDPAFPDGDGRPQAQTQHQRVGHRRIRRGQKPLLRHSQCAQLRDVFAGRLRSKIRNPAQNRRSAESQRLCSAGV